MSPAAKIQIAVLQAKILAGQVLLAGLERRRQAPVENLDPLGANFDLAGPQFRVGGPLGTRRYFARHGNHEFATERSGQFEILLAALRREDDLRSAVSVAKVDEQHAAVVAIGIDPAAQGDFFADMALLQFAACVGAKQRSIPRLSRTLVNWTRNPSF